MKKKKTNKTTAGIKDSIILMLVFGIFGFMMGFLLEGIFDELGFLLSLGVQLFLFLITYSIHLIIHEAGHLVAGLISGWGFGSFRVGSLMIVKEGEKLKLKKHTVAGTGGQCLMMPPPIVNGKYPVIFYNLGGVLMNLVFTVIFGFVAWGLSPFAANSMSGYEFAYAFSVLMVLSGFVTAATNGIPLKLGMVNNDGSNALELYNNEEAMKTLHHQFYVIRELADGKRLREMSEDLFFMPSDEGLKNSISVSAAVFKENRLIDEGKYQEARELIDYLLDADTAMVGIHRNGLIADKITLMLTHDESPQNAIQLYNQKEYQAYAKQMKTNISVVRTEYAYTLIALKDEAKAQKVRENFEKCAKTHPYSADILAERDLLCLIDEKAKQMN